MRKTQRFSRGSAVWPTSIGYSLIRYIFIIGDVYNNLDEYNVFRKVLFIVED